MYINNSKTQLYYIVRGFRGWEMIGKRAKIYNRMENMERAREIHTKNLCTYVRGVMCGVRDDQSFYTDTVTMARQCGKKRTIRYEPQTSEIK